jgi:hypothetical protein
MIKNKLIYRTHHRIQNYSSTKKEIILAHIKYLWQNFIDTCLIHMGSIFQVLCFAILIVELKVR